MAIVSEIECYVSVHEVADVYGCADLDPVTAHTGVGRYQGSVMRIAAGFVRRRSAVGFVRRRSAVVLVSGRRAVAALRRWRAATPLTAVGLRCHGYSPVFEPPNDGTISKLVR
jgi:LDH2 family malate/lactate/ureidoglycolate dehydrogenase